MSEAENTSKKDSSKKDSPKKDSFFKHVKAEFKRCTWPKKEELIRQSTLVIIISVILGGVIAGIDWLIRLGLQAVGL